MKIKNLLITCALLAVSSFVFNCTDEDLANPEPPEHCTDGILNYGELDVDCGGECNSCATLEAPCNPDTNKIILDSSLAIPFPNGTLSYYGVDGDPDSDNYEVSAANLTMYAYIKWHGDRPTEQRVYLLGGTYYLNSFYNEGQANIRLVHQTSGNKAISVGGKLYAKPMPDGKLLITFCDAKFASETNTSVIVYNGISGRFLVP